MEFFCSKCGSRLDINTGKCPNCQSTSPAPANPTPTPTHPKKKMNIRKYFIKMIFIVSLMLALIFGGFCVLGHFGLVNIPIVDKILDVLNLEPKNQEETDYVTEEDDEEETSDDASTEHPTDAVEETTLYEAETIDADEYFDENSQVVKTIDVNSSNALSESEVCSKFNERGFSEYDIVYNYNMDGEYCESGSASSYSSTRHPMYETYFVSSQHVIWIISDINNCITAYPVSINADRENGVEVIVAESDTITSYDSASNTYYETNPDNSILQVIKIDKINKDTLENIKIGG